MMKNKEEIRKQIKALAEEYISCLKEEHKNIDEHLQMLRDL